MRIFIGLCTSAFLIGWLGLCTGCAVTLRGSITPVTAEELVQKGVSDKLYDYLFGAKIEEKKQ